MKVSIMFRCPNSIIFKEAYILPLIEGILNRLPNVEFVTSFDLKGTFLRSAKGRKQRQPLQCLVAQYINLR